MFKGFRNTFFGKGSGHKPAEVHAAGVTSQPEYVGSEGLLPVLHAAQLLKLHAPVLSQINELAGVSKEAFQHFYLLAITAFARYVQQLPASDVHHHTGNGGLLSHSLEVCMLALKVRRSYLLSSQGGAEEIAKKQDLWTYAVFLAALCHDLGKPAFFQRVDIYARPGSNPVRWHPYGGFIDEKGAYYRSVFVQAGRYYPQVTPLLVHAIIPGHGMQWLTSDPLIFSQWLAAIAGDLIHSDALGEIIVRADSLSVSRNLGGGSLLATAVKSKPLHDKILTALRHLLAEGELPLNSQGAAVWIKGTDCWLASKQTGDRLRDQLVQEQHEDAPARNGSLFDCLQTHGVIIPCGAKALWHVTLVGEGWQDTSSVLRIPVSRLWPIMGSMPEDFSGDVIVESGGAEKHGSGIAPAEDAAQQAVLDVTLPDSEIRNNDASVEVTDETAVENSETGMQPALAISSQTRHLPPVEFIAPAIPNNKPARARTTTGVNLEASGGILADFMDWLQSGILQRTIPVNAPNAMVHAVHEGVLLAAPSIFQHYAKVRALPDWKPVQKQILKMNWHRRDDEGLNFVKYQVAGEQKKSVVSGLLITEAHLVFGAARIPNPNPHLTLI